MYDPARVSVTTADGSRSFEVNRYLVQNGNHRELLIYWYQGRGRAVASEYWDKLYTVMDSARPKPPRSIWRRIWRSSCPPRFRPSSRIEFLLKSTEKR